MILLGILIVLLVLLAPQIFFIVPQQNVYIIERLGKFNRTVGAGLNIKIPFFETVAAKVDMRTRQEQFTIDAKTRDNVTVTMAIAAQYRVSAQPAAQGQPSGVWRSYYMLANPTAQMRSYLIDALRSSVPQYTLDEVFDKKDAIASDVNQTHIRSNREVFTQLLSAKYKYNIFQLKNEIHYAISNSIYFSKSSYATLLPHFLSNELRENQMENQNYIKEMTAFVESSIPEFVDFYPNTNCTVLELLAADNMKSILLPKEKKTFQAQAQEDVLRMDVTLAAHIREERLHYLLGYIFAQTRIRYDIPLLNHGVYGVQFAGACVNGHKQAVFPHRIG